MDITSLLALVLVIAMLAITASRVVSIVPLRMDGEHTLDVRVGFLYRALAQRVNVVAILVVLVLGSGTFGERWISPTLFLFTLVALVGLLLVPRTYRLTTIGIAPDAATFRPWSEFTSWSRSGNVIELRTGSRRSTLRLYVGRSDIDAVERVLKRSIRAAR